MQCPASQVPTLLLVPIFYSIQRSDVGFVCGTPRRAQIAPRCINESITCYCFWLQLEAEEKRKRRKEWEKPPCLRMWPPLSPKKKTHTHTPTHICTPASSQHAGPPRHASQARLAAANAGTPVRALCCMTSHCISWRCLSAPSLEITDFRPHLSFNGFCADHTQPRPRLGVLAQWTLDFSRIPTCSAQRGAGCMGLAGARLP